ncbi:MAG: CBS domain-containing protein [Thermoplasmata archaeon]|nr:CBS domain-containing protein [Thermoplasmata archaeon]
MLIDEVMVKDVVTLSGDDTIKDVVEKFAKKKISGAPVLNSDGQLIGILSEKDILNALEVKCKRLEMIYPSLSMVSVSFVECFDDKEVAEAFMEIANTRVSDLMKKDVVTLDNEGTMSRAVDLMNTKSINRIPVLDSGKLVGIITRKDIIKGLAQGSKE